jgi:hypothetical protein
MNLFALPCVPCVEKVMVLPFFGAMSGFLRDQPEIPRRQVSRNDKQGKALLLLLTGALYLLPALAPKPYTCFSSLALLPYAGGAPARAPCLRL